MSSLLDDKFCRFLDVDYLRTFGTVPHWFGLGFIQLKLTNDTRIHFWHPDLLADTPEEELHDHRYRFHSHILLGEITHEEWFIENAPDGDHEIVQVSCKPGDSKDPVPVARGFLRQGSTYHMKAGTSYEFAETGFHRIRATKAVTYLERGPVTKDLANVIREVNAPSVCPFERKIAANKLWDYIADLLPKQPIPGYHLTEIEKGILGEPSKIAEEVNEFMDAVKQGVDIMALVELSDLQGAIEAYLNKHHPSISLQSLRDMAAVTARAFANGRR